MNQVISFTIIGGLDGLDGLGLYPLSTSKSNSGSSTNLDICWEFSEGHIGNLSVFVF